MRPRRLSLSVPQAILMGGLTVGLLDALDAIVVFGLRSGATPMRIFQGIAAGALGPASYQGGWSTALLGVCLHFSIAFGIAAVYILVSRRIPALANRPILFGPIYGVAAYLIMNFLVIPLSALGAPGFTTFGVVNGLLIHMLGVGLPSALAASLVPTPPTAEAPALAGRDAAERRGA